MQVQELHTDELQGSHAVLQIIHTCKRLRAWHTLKLPDPQLRPWLTLKLPEPPTCSLELRCQLLEGLAALPHLRSLGVEILHDRELGIIAELSNLRELKLVVKQECTAAAVGQLLDVREHKQLQTEVDWSF
jgi:hypothetical protein